MWGGGLAGGGGGGIESRGGEEKVTRFVSDKAEEFSAPCLPSSTALVRLSFLD